MHKGKGTNCSLEGILTGWLGARERWGGKGKKKRKEGREKERKRGAGQPSDERKDSLLLTPTLTKKSLSNKITFF